MRTSAVTKSPHARRAEKLVRPLIRRLKAYVPGEQPKIKGLVKLNTNENPYPPSPQVLKAIRAGLDARLRLYPNPTAEPLRNRLARFHNCSPEQIVVGNGSDELLALATRAFVEPESSAPPAGKPSAKTPARHTLPSATIQYFKPSYSLYPVLAAIHGARTNPVPLQPDFSMPPLAALSRSGVWDFQAALTYVTTPNAPSGRFYTVSELDALCRAQRGVIVLDETYADFATNNALALAFRHPHVLVMRTFSKAYSLCFLRVGYCVGHPALITALDKVRDSYNVNGLGQIAAEATLNDLPYYQENFRRIVAQRTRLSQELSRLGFEVLPSQTNFLLTRPPRLPAKAWLEKLRAERILVRWFADPAVHDYLRISIGTETEVTALLTAAGRILRRLQTKR